MHWAGSRQRQSAWRAAMLLGLVGAALAVLGCDLPNLASARTSGPSAASFHAPVHAAQRASAERATCGQPAPEVPGTSSDQTLVSSGVARTYRLHLPVGYDSGRAWPVVLAFHGDSGSAGGTEGSIKLSELADRDAFVAVYPQGAIGRDGSTTWATGGPIDPAVDDVAFVEALLDRLEETVCVDTRRIYATGFSSGGSITGILACEMAGRIAAFAPVSGAFYPRSRPCLPARPVPILEIHGNGDPIVPYTGGTRDDLPPILGWLRQWALRDGCTAGPDSFFQDGDATGLQWTGCAQDATVVHYRIEGGGHAWPGAAGADSQANATWTLDASALIWQFFQAHTLPQP